jgi:hypothetical protein
MIRNNFILLAWPDPPPNSQYAEIYAKKRIGGYWTGFFNALESGRYVFSYKAKGQGSNKSGCWISFYMNDWTFPKKVDTVKSKLLIS